MITWLKAFLRDLQVLFVDLLTVCVCASGVLGLCCCAPASLVERGSGAWAQQLGLQHSWCGLSSPKACGVFPGQGDPVSPVLAKRFLSAAPPEQGRRWCFSHVSTYALVFCSAPNSQLWWLLDTPRSLMTFTLFPLGGFGTTRPPRSPSYSWLRMCGYLGVIKIIFCDSLS